MKVVTNKVLSKVKKVMTTERRRIVITFTDPLFPDETITYSRTFTIKNGVPLPFDVYWFLEERYVKKIGEAWKMLGTSDDGFVSALCRYIPTPVSEWPARLNLVKYRIDVVRATVKKLRELIMKKLK